VNPDISSSIRDQPFIYLLVIITITSLPGSYSNYSNINDGTRSSSYSRGNSSYEQRLFSTTSICNARYCTI
jgi:hypothetical protein